MDNLYEYLKKVFEILGVKYGRDKVRDLMRNKGLLNKNKHESKRDFSSKTEVYNDLDNKIKNLEIVKPNQVWQLDTTILKLTNGTKYALSLVMDSYSRRILGYELNHKMLTKAALLKAFVFGKPEIHHSDRGFEYTSPNMRQFILDNQIKLSYSAKGRPQENGRMERAIGTLKNELRLRYNNNTLEELKTKIDKAIDFYNNERLHKSLKYKTPSEVYFGDLK